VSEESTTPDLEEISRKHVDALNRGDIDAAMSVFQPDAVWDTSPMPRVGGGTPHEGQAAIRQLFEEWMGSFDDYEVVREEFRDLGNGVTLSLNLHKGRPLGSIGFVQLRFASIGIWAEGLIERFTTYPESDIDDARATAERLAQERG
jgi:ketosteroid isomerase-like protein